MEPIEALKSVLCEPNGECCIHGSDEDRRIVDEALAALAPQQVPEPLTARELELIDGMIGVQLEHAMRCDQIANRRMAEKQKGWDMERVALLQKIKAASPQPAPQQVPEGWSVFAKHGRIYFSVGNQSFPLEYHPEDEPECSAAQAAEWYMGQLRHALSRLAAAAPQPAPQKAKWVGLTEQEAAECWSTSTVRTWQAIEAKLREKNEVKK